MLLDQILGFETHAVDAEFIHDLLDSEIRPTAVLMNPPFSATVRIEKYLARREPCCGSDDAGPVPYCIVRAFSARSFEKLSTYFFQ